MGRILWIASYPKTGNTWIRFLLTTLLRGPVASSRDIEVFVPDAHKQAIVAPDPVYRDVMFVKTHWPAERLGQDLARSAGAIYLVRNPLDTFCSCLSYFGVKDAERQSAVDEFARHLGVPLWIKSGIGTLPQHVASWLHAPLPFPRLLLRYEDLSRAPHRALERICAFIGHAAAPADIARVVERCSFAALQALEHEERAAKAGGFFVSELKLRFRPRPEWRFMNRGSLGGHRELLTDHQIDVLAATFGELMAEFGYALDHSRDLVIRDDYPARARMPQTAVF